MTADRVNRRRAVEEGGRSFVVEASAGTGKTSILVERILHCVLHEGPEGAPLLLSRICAITFTEKAAGEMKIRLREEFERRAAEGGGAGDAACQAAAACMGRVHRASIRQDHLRTAPRQHPADAVPALGSADTGLGSGDAGSGPDSRSPDIIVTCSAKFMVCHPKQMG